MADRPLNFRQRCSAPINPQADCGCSHSPPAFITHRIQGRHPLLLFPQNTCTLSLAQISKPERIPQTKRLTPCICSPAPSPSRTHTRGLTPAARQTENQQPNPPLAPTGGEGPGVRGQETSTTPQSVPHRPASREAAKTRSSTTENQKPTTKSPLAPNRGRGVGGEGARDLQHPQALLTGPPHAKPRRREVQQLKTNNWQLKTGN